MKKTFVGAFDLKLYRVYQGFRLNHCKGSEMIIFGALMTSFEASSIF